MRKDNVFQIGKEATGESFIGRKTEIQSIAQRAYAKGIYRSLSMVGLTRVGKSSIIMNAIDEAELQKFGIIYVKIVLCEFDDYISFWKNVIWQIQEKVVCNFGISDARMNESFKKAAQCLADEESSSMIHSCIKTILKHLKIYGIPVLMVIDEFDWARVLFHKQSYFETLRTIASSADFMVNIILVSRRSLYVIEECTPENSTFHGVFEPMTVNVFSEEDMDEYFAVLSQYDIRLDEKEKNLLLHYCGHIPYLLSLFGHDMVECKLAGDNISIQKILRKRYTVLIKYYGDIRKQIEYDHLTDSLRAVVGKPPAGCRMDDQMPLLDMGIIQECEGEYIAVCRHFTECFLEQDKKDRTIPEYTYRKLERSKEQQMQININGGNIIGGVGGERNQITVNDFQVNDVEKIIHALEELKEVANEEEQEELARAVAAANRGEKRELAYSLKKISGFLMSTGSSVAANIIVAYMRANGIIP